MKDLTLILGAAEGNLYVVFAKDHQILCSQEWYIKTKGTELLTQLIQNTLKTIDYTPQNISKIACITGPGSFTALRLILTTAASMRRVLSIPVAPLNYLHVLASSVVSAKDIDIRVVTYARRDLLYMQDFSFDHQKNVCVALTDPETVNLNNTCNTKKTTLFIGSGVIQNIDFFSNQSLSNSHIIFSKQNITISSHALLQATQNLPSTAWGYKDLEPLYLRECDAVENLQNINISKSHPTTYNKIENVLIESVL